MTQIDKMSFFNHMPNCVCKKCGKEREKFIHGKKHSGKVISEEIDIEEFNNMVIPKVDLKNTSFHYKGKFIA